jgi:hypothetical protein
MKIFGFGGFVPNTGVPSKFPISSPSSLISCYMLCPTFIHSLCPSQSSHKSLILFPIGSLFFIPHWWPKVLLFWPNFEGLDKFCLGSDQSFETFVL